MKGGGETWPSLLRMTVDKGGRVTGADIYSALECRLELSLVMLCWVFGISLVEYSLHSLMIVPFQNLRFSVMIVPFESASRFPREWSFGLPGGVIPLARTPRGEQIATVLWDKSAAALLRQHFVSDVAHGIKTYRNPRVFMAKNINRSD